MDKSRYYFKKAHDIWGLLVISLGVDLLLYTEDFSFILQGLTDVAKALLAPLLLVCSLALIKDGALALLLNIERWREKLFESKYQWLILGVLALIILADAISKMDLNVVSIGISLLLCIPAVIALRRKLQETKERVLDLKNNRQLWQEQAEMKVFALEIMPLFAARLLSTAGIALCLSQTPPETTIACLYLLGATLLLLGLEPHQSSFILHCKRCGNSTSRALLLDSHCESCQRSSR